MKIKKRKNLTTTLIIVTTTILIVLNLFTACVTAVVTGRALNGEKDAYLEEIAISARRQVEQFVDQYCAVTDMLAANHQIQVGMNNATKENPFSEGATFADVVDTMKETMEKYPNILGMGIGSIVEDNIYAQDGTRYDVRLSERPYYSSALSNQQTITDPYEDTVAKETCISIVDPINYNGKIVGLLIVDLKLEQFSEYLAEMAFGESGRLILLDASNKIIGAEEEEIRGKSFESIGIKGDKFLKQLNSSNESIEKYELNGEGRIAKTETLPDSNWKIIVAMDQSEYNQNSIRVIAILGALLTIVTAVIIFTIRAILLKKLRPISEINEGLKQMSEGNLGIKIMHEGEDEIGEMADSLRSSVDTLSTYVNAISTGMGELAKGNLDVSAPIKFKGDFAPIQVAIDSFIVKLTHLMKNIHGAAEQVSTGAEQVSSGAQALSQGATEQASSVQELAATIADISQTVKSNTEMVLEASDNANRVNGDIMDSGNKMQQSLEVMSEIRSSSNEISKIIKTIEDIAFQTNILALNAAVEAARAGSAGKGFAVVADEVRNLAGKSAEASQTTTALIETSLAAVEKGTASMEETARSMERVVTEAQKITEVFGAVAAASDEQADSIAQVTLGIDQISGVVQTNSATAEESAAASEELSGQAQLLKSLLMQFRLPKSTDDYGVTTNTDIEIEMPTDVKDDYGMDDTYVSYSNDKY